MFLGVDFPARAGQGTKEDIVTTVVLQSQVLGLLLYVLEGAMIIGFGDDMVVIFTATHSEDVNVYATETVRAAKP